MYTPWGVAQQAEQLSDDVVSVYTAGHGGIHVGTESLKRIPEGYHQTWAGEVGWYEEDSDVIVPMYYLPEVRAHFNLTQEGCEAEFRAWQSRHDEDGRYARDKG